MHKDGWTGKEQNVLIIDERVGADHAIRIENILQSVAPSADITQTSIWAQVGTPSNLDNVSVASISVSFNPRYLAKWESIQTKLDSLIKHMEQSDTVVTVAAAHSNFENGASLGGQDGRGTTNGFSECLSTQQLTVAKCSSWANSGLDSDNVIYVGEVLTNDKIPLWSNQAGEEHKNQFIVTASNTIRYDSTSPKGNSLAAPRVAGTAVLVRHKFPNLTAKQTATVILHTTDDLGAVGVDAVYGHGKLNVGKALSPVGNLR